MMRSWRTAMIGSDQWLMAHVSPPVTRPRPVSGLWRPRPPAVSAAFWPSERLRLWNSSLTSGKIRWACNYTLGVLVQGL